jgi:hypothetical protein
MAGGANLYLYASANPLFWVDLLGLCGESYYENPGPSWEDRMNSVVLKPTRDEQVAYSRYLAGIVRQYPEAVGEINYTPSLQAAIDQKQTMDLAINFSGGMKLKGAAGGRLGSALTRQHVADVAAEMESRGWEITGGGGKFPEEYLPGPGGARLGSSFPDIKATKGGNTLRVNTVDTYVDGITPTIREAVNAGRIRRQTGEHLLLVPKP